jgi:hypothetical protein
VGAGAAVRQRRPHPEEEAVPVRRAVGREHMLGRRWVLYIRVHGHGLGAACRVRGV